ncbi:UDP-N-acetylmuramoyl-L-alanine--D-glutamate ligase [Clostridium aminobutyricum]|uniref:UDP-N-acetylmuramoylalanine--D-glutamate ligase n=1 Tax=Clostridium aminobutyricum TaxID=33953 RepID=A0A939DAX6_CLOAM|nr:UDP-N-acetylmuramoyl-L-alanine--D-glutamate ligase [Clostridium aminobutyricum]MBN7774247.1 UDP-N-acetylmuramoyl-L-alanine--D-glutamate ligase [Clostridium aminobutyricum]
MNNNMENKKVLVVGMGKSGIAAAQALLRLGAKVSVQDSKKESEIEPQLLTFLRGKAERCYFGIQPDALDDLDMMVLSPGVSPELGFVQEAVAKGVEVIGELEIAYRVGRGNYIAITGTNGKTTTTTLVGEIFKNAKKKTYVVGNIGVAVISMALTAEADSWLITETSSFQLETTKYFKPQVSAILNLTPDHMNRHHTMENYGAAKAKIYQNQDESGYFVVNYDDPGAYALRENCKKAKIVPFSRKVELEYGAFVKDAKIVLINDSGELIEFCGINELNIPGDHNLENALAAAAISYLAGIDPQVITDTLSAFQGVEHRLEYCGEIDGVRFVNDSKGTNPDASIKAIEAMQGGIILIAGGYDKGSDFTEFIQSFKGRVKHMVLLGKTAPIIKEQAEAVGFNRTTMAKNMEECVSIAFKLATPGDTVLLSPACASWDMYTCFEQRGEHFKTCVHGLEK